MSLKFKTLILITVLIFVGSCVFVGAKKTWSKRGELTVVIDAGHGGIDGGVVTSNGIKESELNLDIAKKIRDKLEGYGINVVMTRTGSGGLYGLTTKGFKKRDMQKRKEIILSANADLVVSVHINKCPFSYRRGPQVFYKIADSQSKEFALFLQDKLNQMPTAVEEGLSLVGDYYVLNCSNVPSVLVECGFVSNSEDEKLLLLEEYRFQLAEVISSAVLTRLLQTKTLPN